VFAAEHLLGFAGLDLNGEFVQGTRKVVPDRLSGFYPFGENVEVVDLFPERIRKLAILFEPATALKQFLGVCLVLPEIWSGNAFFYAGEFVGGLGRVKDGSADRRRGGPVPDVCGAARLVVGPC
jgi:hypothetical protein